MPLSRRDATPAIEAFGCIRSPDAAQLALIAAAQAALGDDPASACQRDRALVVNPAFTIGEHLKSAHYQRVDDRRHEEEALRRAGFLP